MKILLIDKNHSILIEKLTAAGFEIEEDYSSNYHQIAEKIHQYQGLIIRSRIPINQNLLQKASSLQFIGRVGAGMENIDVDYARQHNITLINAPEGNRDALAEQAVGMLLAIMNRFKIADQEVRKGIWLREENRGEEILGKTVALIGYGYMGKAFAQRLSGFGCKIIFYDILPNLEDHNAKQVTMESVFEKADILSFHVPETPLTYHLLNDEYLAKFQKPIYFINTARGKNVSTQALVNGLKSGKIKAAALDVLEFEKSSFENLNFENLSPEIQYLFSADNVLLTPHIAGWTHESKIKLAEVTADKIIEKFAKKA